MITINYTKTENAYYTIEKKEPKSNTIVITKPRYWIYYNDVNLKFPVKSFASKNYAIKYLNKYGVYDINIK